LRREGERVQERNLMKIGGKKITSKEQ